jgi:phosphofructokinase-like protein
MRIGVSTGGGDCPGLNAVIRAVVKTALHRNWEVVGIERGFEGLLNVRHAHFLHPHDVSDILNIGGTILGTANRGDPFKLTIQKGGKTIVKDVSKKILAGVRKLKLDAIICIGGDGTLGIAKRLGDMGVPIVGVPKTIDNDLSATVVTFGYDTAVSTATDALDKLHSTAKSHQRTMVMEVMGRYAGWIALNSGVAGGADVILIPEIPFDINKVCRKVEERYRTHQDYCIIVAAEAAKPKDQKGMFTKDCREKDRKEVLLGGIAEWVSNEVAKRTGRETRSLVLGHLQRGGHPTTFDRLIATRFGAAAVRLVEERKFNHMVALRPPNIVAVPLEEAIGKMNSVPLDSDTILSAREMGVCFGD